MFWETVIMLLAGLCVGWSSSNVQRAHRMWRKADRMWRKAEAELLKQREVLAEAHRLAVDVERLMGHPHRLPCVACTLLRRGP